MYFYSFSGNSSLFHLYFKVHQIGLSCFYLLEIDFIISERYLYVNMHYFFHYILYFYALTSIISAKHAVIITNF